MLHRAWPRSLGKKGAATGALIPQRLRAVLVVAVQPAHHSLRMAAGARGYLRRAGALGDVVQGQETLAAAGMHSIQGQAAQSCQRLAPALVVNS